jgi:hypothetical protein
MALTGKTIGELSYLQFPTNDTLIPVQYVGDTYHISFSSITYTEGTYSQFVAEAGNGLLTPGRYYLMTDYQAIYDQPNYDNFKQPIFTGNTMTGITEPLLLLAISETQFSPNVYSTVHPQDQITYDITWDTTEISSTPAKGRITERIDQYNNRADYDHRNIFFKRYRGYSYNENDPLTGLVGISGVTGTTGILYGNAGTTFNSSLSPGTFIAISSLNPYLFQVTSVESDSIAIISGVTINVTSNSPYYYANDDGIMSYYQPNIRQNQVYEYTTFGDAIGETSAVNNYIGNYSNLYLYEGLGDFLLANNVLIGGAYTNNTIGNGSYNNTFFDDCDNNQIGDSFYNNSTNDDFDGNIIGERFNNNYITANFNNNRIGSDFNDNILINGSFYRNNIGNDFNGNTCTSNDFQNNEIGNQFQNNQIYNNFYKNDIGNGYNNNIIRTSFYGNLLGNGWNNNDICGNFQDNVVGDYFNTNTIGDLTDIGGIIFDENRIGYNFNNNIIKNDFRGNDILNDFNQNTIYFTFRKNKIMNNFNTSTIGATGNTDNYFQNNQIMDNFKGNDVGGEFSNNNLKTDFKGNEILNEFSYNNVGYSFLANNLEGAYMYNNIGDLFQFNSCYGTFQYNTIGTEFYSNEVQDGFGFGGGSYQGNRIGNNFYDNIIGEYFYNNTIPDNFFNNIIGDYFQWNIVDTYVDNVDFTTNYKSISGITYAATGDTATEGSYSNLAGTTSGSGVNALFSIDVISGSVTNVSVVNPGKLYTVGDTITILGTQIGGTDVVDDVIITVASLEPNPSVYELYTCNIFKNSNLTNRLSYYDASDVLTIKNINE